jgi:hypothetical protein
MCTEDLCYAEVGFNTIIYYDQFGKSSEKTNVLSLKDRRETASTVPVLGNTKIRKILQHLHKICKMNALLLAMSIALLGVEFTK